MQIGPERDEILKAVQEASKNPVPQKSVLLAHRRVLVDALVRLQRKTHFLVWQTNQKIIAKQGFKRPGPPPQVKTYAFQAQALPADVLRPAFTDLEQTLAQLEKMQEGPNFDPAAAYKLSYTAAALQEEIFKFSYGAVEYALMAWEIEADSNGLKGKMSQNGKAPELQSSRLTGPLFAKQGGDGHNVSAEDVKQGQIGDCYFMATMAAVAHTDPQKVADMIRPNGDGTYTVMLRSWVTKSPTSVVVSDHVLQYSGVGGAYYARGRAAPGGGIEKWPSILERAYAKWKGGYDDASNSDAWFGTSTEGAMTRFGPSETHSVDNAADSLKLLEEAQKNGWPTVVSARAWDEPNGFRENARTFLRGEWADWRKERQTAAARTQVAAGNHAYTFLKVEGGKIHLRNPWGQSHPLPMTPDDFVLLFTEIVRGKF